MKLSVKLSEAQIQKQILDYLDLRGIFAWKASSTGIYDPKRQTFRRNPHTIGVADIIGIRPIQILGIAPVAGLRPADWTVGRFLAIEVKSAKGKLSPAQESFRDAVQLNGGLYVEAHSLEDVERALEGLK